MNRAIKGLVITVLFAVLLNAVMFIPSVSAAENLPTVWVKIYRIQAVDDIENVLESEADWRYTITVSDGETSTKREFKCPPNLDNIVVERSDSFTDIKNQDVFVTIALYEDDMLGHETADISSSGTAFDCTYNLASNELGGDETIIEGDYYKTSGDYDGSQEKDENDANIWFAIFDNYDAPVANAGEDQSVYTGEEAKFDGSLSTASEGSSIVKFEWDFENDGIIDAEGETTSHTYDQKGTRTCRMVVTDSIGVMSEDTSIVNVLNRVPKADFTFSPSNISIEDVVNITDASSDSDGTIISWAWDFGDGTTSKAKNPYHAYSQKGEYRVRLTVMDNDDAKSSITKTLTVINLKPSAAFEFNNTDLQTDMDIQFMDNSVDPENSPISWFWDFGDGNTSDLQTPTHKFATQGDYNVTLTVTDDENATDTYTMTVSVTEAPQPEASGEVDLWIIAVAAIVIATIGFLGIVWWNRRRQSFSEMFTGSDGPTNCVRRIT